MSVLTREDILREISKKNMVFSPEISEDQIKGISIDLTLGNEFRAFDSNGTLIKVKEDTDYHDYSTAKICEQISLEPGDTILGITQERIQLPDNIFGMIEGRSRFARLGLMIHISAGLIHPGVNNKQVLEISNMSKNTLVLFPGERICQIILMYSGRAVSYSGQYRNQVET